MENDFDATVRLTSSAISGTALHFVRGVAPRLLRVAS
jgi:hypothetical protein